jgi:hypothetical protein
MFTDQCYGSGSGICCFFDPRIRTWDKFIFRISDLHISESLLTIFWVKLLTFLSNGSNFFSIVGSGIRDRVPRMGKKQDPGKTFRMGATLVLTSYGKGSNTVQIWVHEKLIQDRKICLPGSKKFRTSLLPPRNR